jgi:hypothetical protein
LKGWGVRAGVERGGEDEILGGLCRSQTDV